MTYDLMVIGAGPAGCAAAITAARRGAKVLLLESGRFPRHKVCGEFVSGEALELLTELLSEDDDGVVANAARIERSQIFVDGAVLRMRINPPAASITRFKMDHALWESACKAGVDGGQGCPVRSLAGDGPFYVAAGSDRFEGRAVVNAAGRWSFLTDPQVRSRASGERWLGVKGHFREPGNANSVDLYFFDGGYCGVQPVTSSDAERVVNACAMVRAKIGSKLEDVVKCHPALWERSQHWMPAMQAVQTAPLIFHAPQPRQGNVLQIGDAATFVDPFIGDGISLALRSGRLAADSLRPFFTGEISLAQAAAGYAQRYRRDLAPVFRASSTFRKLLSFPYAIRKPVMSVLQRAPLITSQFVKLTR
jgi:flavin-dependent dehydrogenase